MKKLTVFTPTYNRAYILKQCYDALKRQTCKDFLWMVVDDGSTDSTNQLVQQFINEKIIDIVYIYQDNGGKYKAVNTAVRNCKTELFCFLDSDDYYKDNTVEFFLEKWKEIENDQSIAGIVGRRCNNDGIAVGTTKSFNEGKVNFLNMMYKLKFYGDTCRMYRTQLLKDVMYPELEEKFMSENIMLGKIDNNYDVYYTNKSLSVSEYLNDGYTNSSKQVVLNNPKSYMLSLMQDIASKIPLKYKIKRTLSYIIWGKKHHFKNMYKDIPNKCLYIICYPIAMIFIILGVPTWYTPNRGALNKLKIWSKVIISFILSFLGSKANIYDCEETVKVVRNENKSLIRLGDGEFNILSGEDICYQRCSEDLKNNLKSVIEKYETNPNDCNYIVCVPNFFMKCSGFELMKKRVWVACWAYSRYTFIKKFNQKVPYGDAFIFSKNNKSIYEKIWNEGKFKNCIFVHNDECYADMFQKQYGISTQFVRIPNKDSYNQIDTIYENICKALSTINTSETIVLVSGGPMAKVLVPRLSDKCLAIDTGHCWDKPLIGVRK